MYPSAAQVGTARPALTCTPGPYRTVCTPILTWSLEVSTSSLSLPSLSRCQASGWHHHSEEGGGRWCHQPATTSTGRWIQERRSPWQWEAANGWRMKLLCLSYGALKGCAVSHKCTALSRCLLTVCALVCAKACGFGGHGGGVSAQLVCARSQIHFLHY